GDGVARGAGNGGGGGVRGDPGGGPSGAAVPGGLARSVRHVRRIRCGAAGRRRNAGERVVNPTLAAAFLRQRLTSPMRVGLLLLLAVTTLCAVALMRTVSPLGGLAAPIALILAAGAIGQDVSSGTLQLLLVRPVSRPSVIVSRWLAVVMATTAIEAGLLVLGTLAMMLRGTHPDALDLIRMLLETACVAAGYAAVMIMFSTLVGGLGDLGLYLASYFVISMLGGLGMWENWAWLQRASTEM